MTVDEQARYELHQAFEDLMGPDKAADVMALLPPVGWADVATKQDLSVLKAALEERMDLRFEAQDHKLEALLHRELKAQYRSIVVTMTVITGAMISVASAVAGFLG